MSALLTCRIDVSGLTPQVVKLCHRLEALINRELAGWAFATPLPDLKLIFSAGPEVEVSDVVASFKFMDEDRKEHRRRNREIGAQLLTEAGFSFESYNDGAHLIIPDGPEGPVSYWPGTGLWGVKGNYVNRGIKSLLRYLKRG